jgi:hypothetical protein
VDEGASLEGRTIEECVCVCVCGCKAFVGAKSLDDLEDVKANFLNQIEEEFENQLDHYIEFVDMAYFAFMFK